MSVARTVLLKVSDNQWLRENGTRLPFIRRAVSKFMPGESFDEMIVAARATAAEGHSRGLHPARRERQGPRRGRRGRAATTSKASIGCARCDLDCEPSIKLTQLGLDIDRELAYAHLRDLAARAHAADNYLWIDMEQSAYVDVTLDADQAAARGVSAHRRLPAGLPVPDARRSRGHDLARHRRAPGQGRVQRAGRRRLPEEERRRCELPTRSRRSCSARPPAPPARARSSAPTTCR